MELGLGGLRLGLGLDNILKLKYIFIDNQFVFITASCLILSWVLVYLAMVKGITESPKVVYVSTIILF